MELPGESKNEERDNGLIDVNACLIASPTLSVSNSLKWEPKWEAHLIIEGKNDVGNLYQGTSIVFR